tara:strand:- start:124 stop:333 length:210 start_codon:yes stop_codon:yes gene_type:complete
MDINNYVALEDNTDQEPLLKFLPKNSKRDKKRYKRNIKKQRRSYFNKCVEDNTYLNDEFLETIHNWYFK